MAAKVAWSADEARLRPAVVRVSASPDKAALTARVMAGWPVLGSGMTTMHIGERLAYRAGHGRRRLLSAACRRPLPSGMGGIRRQAIRRPGRRRAVVEARRPYLVPAALALPRPTAPTRDGDEEASLTPAAINGASRTPQLPALGKTPMAGCLLLRGFADGGLMRRDGVGSLGAHGHCHSPNNSATPPRLRACWIQGTCSRRGSGKMYSLNRWGILASRASSCSGIGFGAEFGLTSAASGKRASAAQRETIPTQLGHELSRP